MTKIRVGINGMGRIGRNICRVLTQELSDRFDIVGANDLLPTDALAGAMQRDSVHGFFPVAVEVSAQGELCFGTHRVQVFAEKDANAIPWGDLGVDVVFECSRFYLTTAKASAHLHAGAKKVILSAPPKDETPIFVVGVNDDALTADNHVISNASCTTNCLAPLVKALDDTFGLVSGLVSTTHAATSDQTLVDAIGPAKDRAALDNIIPTSTGAARAIGKVLPHLDGLLNGSALRVPVSDGSVLEAVFVVQGERTVADVMAQMTAQAEAINARSATGTILYIGDRYQVSKDVIGAPWSSMVLAENTQVIPFDAFSLVKLTAIYDNEMGYSYRMADLAIRLIDAT